MAQIEELFTLAKTLNPNCEHQASSQLQEIIEQMQEGASK